MSEVIGGSHLRVCIWDEATYGSETPGTAFELPVSWEGFNIGETQDLIESSIARASRKEAIPFDGLINAEGLTMKILGHYDSIWHILKHAIESGITTAGTDPYTHEVVIDELPPGFGLEVALVDETTAADSWICQAYGCRISQLALPLAMPAGELPLDVTFEAKKVTSWAQGTPITATSYTEDPILFTDQDALSIDAGALTDVTDATLTIDMGLESHKTAMGGGRTGMVGIGVAKVRGNIKALFHDSTTYNTLAESGTMFQLISSFASGTDIFKITMGHCRMNKGPTSIQGPQGIPVDRDFGAYLDDTDATTPIKIEGTNSTASY